MPSNKENIVDSRWTKPLIEAARRVYNKIFGLTSGYISNDAKYGFDLGSLKYSQNELLRIASQSHNFADRAERVTNYLVACNPHLKESVGRMNSVTKRLFYKRLSDDTQFNWCLDKYPEIEFGDSHMRPGLGGLHILDSVSRDIYRKKSISSPLGAILLFFLHSHARREEDLNNPSQRDLMQ